MSIEEETSGINEYGFVNSCRRLLWSGWSKGVIGVFSSHNKLALRGDLHRIKVMLVEITCVVGREVRLCTVATTCRCIG